MKARILLAEDNLEIASFMTDYLSMNGYDVETVANGVQLLRKAEEARPDMIITDVQMDGGFGSTAYLEIQKNQRLKGVPIVFISARPMESPLPQEQHVRFLQKPVALKGLQQLIIDLLPLGGYHP